MGHPCDADGAQGGVDFRTGAGELKEKPTAEGLGDFQPFGL